MTQSERVCVSEPLMNTTSVSEKTALFSAEIQDSHVNMLASGESIKYDTYCRKIYTHTHIFSFHKTTLLPDIRC